jgi:hypothetical protein
MIYLSAPYNHSKFWVVENRMRYVERALAHYAAAGVPATSPLLMHHCLNTGIKLPSTFEFWEKLCADYWVKCDSLVVLTLPGWKDSEGVRKELSRAKRDGKPVSYLDVEEIYPR